MTLQHVTYFYLSGSARGIENSIAPDIGNKIYEKSVARGADSVGRARLSAPRECVNGERAARGLRLEFTVGVCAAAAAAHT
jgi:hypothetical protein